MTHGRSTDPQARLSTASSSWKSLGSNLSFWRRTCCRRRRASTWLTRSPVRSWPRCTNEAGEGERVIKRIGCAIRHPSNRSLEDFQAYWAQHHGPLFSHTPDLRRYVQHITLTEAYGGTPAPTHDGVSMFWYDGMESVLDPPQSPRLIDIVPATHTDTFGGTCARAGAARRTR